MHKGGGMESVGAVEAVAHRKHQNISSIRLVMAGKIASVFFRPSTSKVAAAVGAAAAHDLITRKPKRQFSTVFLVPATNSWMYVDCKRNPFTAT